MIKLRLASVERTSAHTEARTDRFVAALNRNDGRPAPSSASPTRCGRSSPGIFAQPAATRRGHVPSRPQRPHRHRHRRGRRPDAARRSARTHRGARSNPRRAQADDRRSSYTLFSPHFSCGRCWEWAHRGTRTMPKVETNRSRGRRQTGRRGIAERRWRRSRQVRPGGPTIDHRAPPSNPVARCSSIAQGGGLDLGARSAEGGVRASIHRADRR